MRTPHNERISPDIANVPSAQIALASEGACAQRKCILSGNIGTRAGLLRLAIAPDGTVLADPLAKAPGRGAWIGVTKAGLQEAIAKGKLRGALTRSLKDSNLVIPANLPDMAELGLHKALRDRLGLAMRSGAVIVGSERIAEQARMGRVSAVFHASDASEDGRKKLDQAWRVGQEIEGSGARGTTLPLDRTALSAALGRDNVVHFALSALRQHQGVSEQVMGLAARVAAFRGHDENAQSPEQGDGCGTHKTTTTEFDERSDMNLSNEG